MLNSALLSLLITFTVPQSNGTSSADIERRVADLLGKMTREEKIDYIGGYQDFNTQPIPRLGIPSMRMSDGPAGVRNFGPDTAYAAPVTMAASWDRQLANRVGHSFGLDARKRNTHIVLAPGVNIARVPMNGRNFEYLGEDPYLAAQLVAPYVRGVQAEGVIATVKHFAANSQEHGRNDYSMDVDHRTMREIYLPAFEAAVKEGGVWSVMCAYNLLNGTYCSANHWLLTDVLKNDWGFRGFVMSDWGAVHDSVPVVNAGMDLEMPGPEFLNRKNLLPALQSGAVSEATIDDKVRRMLRSFVSMGFLDRPQLRDELPAKSPFGDDTVLQEAREGMVLLKNSGNILPLSGGIKRIAVIGPNANPAVTGGGGSSFTQPFTAISVLDAIKARARGIDVIYASGVDRTPPEVYAQSQFLTPDGQTGLRGEYFANPNLDGAPTTVRSDRTVDFNFQGNPAEGVPHDNFSVRWTGSVLPKATGDFEFDAVGDDGYRVFIDGRRVIDEWREQGATESRAVVHLDGGRSHAIRIEYFQARGEAEIRVGWRGLTRHAIDLAVQAAKGADIAIVSVGFNSDKEGEGEDRTFHLPDGQDELIKAVSAANPHTIVVLNAGHAVDALPWVNGISGLIHAWYPGQSGNRALAEILFGDTNPSGKLPISFDAKWEESAAYGNYPGDPTKKHVNYAEGLFVGYRHYDLAKKKPLYPFGFGLSYTNYSYSKLTVNRVRTPDLVVSVSFDLKNTGRRGGSEVSQLYVQPEGAPVPRPLKELKGFTRVELRPGETQHVNLTLNRRAFAYWDEGTKEWVVAHGKYRILVGGSSTTLPLGETIRL